MLEQKTSLVSVRYIPMLIVMAVIFFLSSQPDIPLPQTISFQDKILHFAAYGVLAVTVLWARRSVSSVACLGVVVYCLLYGISDEFHQSFVPGRTSSVYDVIADGVGASFVAFFWLMIKKS